MASVDIDASELDFVNKSLSAMSTNADIKSFSLENELADDMVSAIVTSIFKTFDENGRDSKEQIALHKSFKTRPGPESTTIISTAPHARPLEDGVIPHYITPDSASALTFFPENIGDYPEHARNGDGSVTLGRVFWKPDEEPGGYKYILNAQRQNEPLMEMKINDAVSDIIRQSGFNRL